jgi:hypothetical protein
MWKDKDLLRSFKASRLAEDIGKTPEMNEFFSLMGRPPAGTPTEFNAGWLGKIPGFNKFTESTYVFTTRQSYWQYSRMWKDLVDHGVPELAAKAAAADKTGQVFPLLNYSRLGQSQSRTALLRALPTSYSFIRQPATLVAEATRGLAKMGAKKPLTPRELLAVKLGVTLAASTVTASALSAAISAKARGEDVQHAILMAINPDPSNGRFLSVVVGNRAIPIGGPYRGLIRAIAPVKVEGVPGVVPFAGIPKYVESRINPAVGTQLEIVKDRARPEAMRSIVKGNAPEQILRSLAYELEGAAPLTLGTGIEGVRQGRDAGLIEERMAGQFLGSSSNIPSKTRELAAKWENDFEAYKAIPGDVNKAKAEAKTTRDIYRKKNPEIEAKLFITGTDRVTSLSTSNAYAAAVKLMKENKLSVEDIKSLDPKDYESATDAARRRYFEDALGVPANKRRAPKKTGRASFDPFNVGGQ